MMDVWRQMLTTAGLGRLAHAKPRITLLPLTAGAASFLLASLILGGDGMGRARDTTASSGVGDDPPVASVIVARANDVMASDALDPAALDAAVERADSVLDVDHRAFEPAAGPGEQDRQSIADAGAPGDLSATAEDLPEIPATSEELNLIALELQRRRDEIEKQLEELALRKAAADAVEARLAEQIETLKALREDLSAMTRAVSDEDQREIGQLTKVYEAMKAKKAARIFDELELPILLQLVKGMRDTKVAAIVADMDPLKAKRLTAALAATQTLPELR